MDILVDLKCHILHKFIVRNQLYNVIMIKTREGTRHKELEGGFWFDKNLPKNTI
jgi:hypothetical protein